MAHARALALLLAVLFAAASGALESQRLSVVGMLDRYAAGQFDGVVRDLSALRDFDDLLKQLKEDGPAWIEAEGPADRGRRELAAATFALEAARVDGWYEWKWLLKQPAISPLAGPDGSTPRGGSYQPLNVLYWRPPPLLIEWGCEILRRNDTPRPIERWWQIAAVAVAQRSEDPQFLIGDTAIGRGVGAGEIINAQKEIKHLDHAQSRFPQEARFKLAQGIARDRDWQDDALVAYRGVASDPDVGGEAVMRLGAMQFRQGLGDEALTSFDRAETLTRDPYVIYLARFFKGQLWDARRHPDRAQAAYRGAVMAWPNGQAATVALAASLFRDGRRTEAHELAGAMLAADPPPFDPWRAYMQADDRFWPQLIARLRMEIQR